jgi:hypothetical protein
MQTTYSKLMLGHGFPKSLISHCHCRSSDVLPLIGNNVHHVQEILGQCMFIFTDSTPYLWLDDTRLQQKPQMLQAKID